MANDNLKFGPLPASTVHICVDMQRLFDEPSEWATPWLKRVLPNICQLVEAHPAQTVFTRFIPAERPGQGEGTWRRYYERWASMTLSAIGRDMIELLPDLKTFVPPATVVDKHVYSPWDETDLHKQLKQHGVDTLVISGGEIDVCVLATVLGAVDRGYRIVIAKDALCSSSDDTYDAAMKVYHRRYGQQIEALETSEILTNWR